MITIQQLSWSQIVDILGHKFLSEAKAVDSRSWQGLDISDRPEMTPIELRNVVMEFRHLPNNIAGLQEMVKPNLPWAEDHFQERVSGVPHNPPPSHEWWPFARHNNDEFRKDQQFSHTYPERFWPKRAGTAFGPWNEGTSDVIDNRGIRYSYGDLSDVVEQLRKDPATRQAYLPVWFPEDTGAVHGERVPCTLGYHFMIRDDRIHNNYFIRSCDFMRHFVDDVYMAHRLTHWITDQLWKDLQVGSGSLTMFVGSFHIFAGDVPLLRNRVMKHETNKG